MSSQRGMDRPDLQIVVARDEQEQEEPLPERREVCQEEVHVDVQPGGP